MSASARWSSHSSRAAVQGHAWPRRSGPVTAGSGRRPGPARRLPRPSVVRVAGPVAPRGPRGRPAGPGRVGPGRFVGRGVSLAAGAVEGAGCGGHRLCVLLAQAAAQRLRIEAFVDGAVQQLGEGVVGVDGQGAAEGDARRGSVLGGPAHPAGEGERCHRVFGVAAGAAAGEGTPEPEGRRGGGAVHPLRRPVTGDPVLEAENEIGGLGVGDQRVVAGVPGPVAARGGVLTEPVDHGAGQIEGVPADGRRTVPPEHARHQRAGCRVQRLLLLGGPRPGAGPQPGLHLLEGAAHLHSRVGGGRGHHGRAGHDHGCALRGAAAEVGAAVGPEAAVGEAEGFQDRYVECAAGGTQPLGERAEPVLDVLAALARRGLLAEVDDDRRGPVVTLLACRDQTVGELVGDVRPLRAVGRDAEPDPAAEASALAVQSDHDDAVVRIEAQKIRQGVGELGRAAQGDLGVGGRCGGRIGGGGGVGGAGRGGRGRTGSGSRRCRRGWRGRKGWWCSRGQPGRPVLRCRWGQWGQ